MTNAGKQADPGWYPDPQMTGTRRYWDGAKWTDHRAPAETVVATGPGFWTLMRAVAIGILVAGACIWFVVSCSIEQQRTDCHLKNVDRAVAGEPTVDCG